MSKSIVTRTSTSSTTCRPTSSYFIQVEFDYRFLDEWDDEDDGDSKSIVSSNGGEEIVGKSAGPLKYTHPLQVMVSATLFIAV